MSQILQRIEREMKQRQRSRVQIWIRRISIAFLCLAIPIIAGEFALRLAGFNRPQIDFSSQEKSLQQATEILNQRFKTDAFEFDPHLFWKLKPGTNLDGLQVNKEGILSWPPPPEGPRQVNPITVLCLGDSVSAVTYRTYPEIAEKLAAAGGTTERPIHFINAAVPGYTTEQALRRMSSIRSLVPDVVIFCFGWNDHFPALNLPDRELGASNAGLAAIHDLLKNVRLYQLLGAPLGAKGITSESDNNDSRPNDYRVGPVQFRANLEQLINTTREWNAIPVLATQPANFTDTTRQFLKLNNFMAPEGRENEKIHDRYNEIIRQVAAVQKAPLLDLEEEFIRRPREFMLEPDGIHLTGRGHNHVARLVLGMMKNEGLITAGDYDAIARAEKHDSTAPDKPRITWSLSPEALSAPAGTNFTFSAIPQNSGNTRWLRSNIIPAFNLEKNVSYGSSFIYARWRTLGSPGTGIAREVPVPSDILPGEATSVTLLLKAPATPGNYELEIGMRADRIGPLSLYGAETTTLTVTSIESR